MGVYIRGMEMPKSCAECLLIHFHDEHAYCEEYELTYDWDEKLQEGRNENCPLIEIPTPHGRLVDAAEILEHRYVHMNSAKEKDDKINSFRRGWNYALESVAEWAPTIIPAEPCNDLAKPNNTIFAVQNADEDEGLFAAKPIDYMHTPSVEEIIKGDGE